MGVNRVNLVYKHPGYDADDAKSVARCRKKPPRVDIGMPGASTVFKRFLKVPISFPNTDGLKSPTGDCKSQPRREQSSFV